MTSTEKFILKEEGAREAVVALLKVFDGKSYKFANTALNTAKMFINEESQFNAKKALDKIKSMSEEKAVKKNSRK